LPETKAKIAHNGRISLYATQGIGQKQFSLNAPASRLKKSCRGLKSKAEEIVPWVEKQFPAMRLVKLELEIFRWGLVVFRFGWCVSEAEGRRICATP